MFQIQREKYPYRKSTLGIVLDDQNNFLVVNKQAYKENEWSFSGGGIEEGETPAQAVLRELKEELGSNNFTVIAESKINNVYDWPDEVILKQYKKKHELFRGQEVKHFLVKFSGKKEEMKPETREIKVIKWVTYEELPHHLIFPNQWQTVEKILAELL